jgi:nucleotide-binding universal stress UspA family protein
MTYATLMVHLDLGQSNARLLQIAGDLAKQCRSCVIGIVACRPTPLAYGDVCVAGEVVERDRKDTQSEIEAAEAEFRSALQTDVTTLEWRAMTTSVLSDCVAREARCADLIVTSAAAGTLLAASSRMNMADLVMQAGRPVLIVPSKADKLSLERVVIAWKDTHEARRAVLDALPLLKSATHVAVVEIAPDEEHPAVRAHLEDVVLWLKRHDIDAETLVSAPAGNDATRLNAVAEELRADLIVAGAYGHSRMREWVLGGVTGDLLLHAGRCTLVSH